MSGWVQIDAADRAPAERGDYWRSTVCDQFVPLAVEPAGEVLRGRVAGRSIAETRLRRIRATRHTFERRARDIRVDDPGVLHLLFQDHGQATMEQDGRTATLNTGDLLLYDSSRPFRFRTAEEFGFTICLLPKRLLPLPEKLQKEQTARIFSSRAGVGAATAALLTSMARAPYRHEVTLRVQGTPDQIRQRLPASVAEVRDGADKGWQQVEIRAESLDWLPAVLAALDLPFVVERPDELRDRIIALADRLATSARRQS